jgi:rod shape-determining protein MreD
MLGEAQASGLRVTASVLVALLLTIVPLPHGLELARPDWLLLVVFYWSLVAPRIAGLAYAWLCGFAVDVIRGIVLGQHALAFLLAAAIAHHFQLRLRIFPVWQQAFAIGLLLLLYQFVVFWIDGVVGQPVTTWLRWIPALVGALLWPALVAVLDTWNRRRRF